jgi:hypothetical protein
MKTTNMTKSILTLAGTALVCSTSLQAAAALYESFDYADGGFNLNGAGAAGDGWSGAWSVEGQKNTYGSVISPGLTYGSLDVAGNAAGDAPGWDFWGGADRQFGSTLSDAGLLDNGAELWFSVLVDVSAVGGTSKLGFALADSNFGTSDTNLGSAGVGLYGSNSAANVKAASWSGGSQSLSGTSTSGAGGPVLFVGQINWGAEYGNETLTLYTPDAALNLGTAVDTHVFSDINQGGIDRVTLMYKEGTQVDEIRIGGSYNDVIGVPEPSSAALLGLGGLALMFRRRK